MLIGLSTRFKQRPLVFKYPSREGLVASSVFLLVLIFTIVFHVNKYQPVRLMAIYPDNIILWKRLFIGALCLLPVVLALYIRKQPLLSAGWSKHSLSIAVRTGIALGFLTIFLRGKIFNIIDGITTIESQSLLLWLGIVICEESVFRGYLQPRVSAWVGDKIGWIIVALGYSLWHLPRLLETPESIWFNFTFVLVQGLILGWLMRKTGHAATNVLYRTVSEWLWYLH